MSTAFLFSGQGSQYVGMGRDLTDAYPHFAELYVKASNILGFDLRKICFSGTEEELAQTRIAQPAIMITSIVACESAKIKGINASAVAGHSLGEYAALVMSGMLSFEDGFTVIKARSEAMQSAALANPGAMAAVLGMDPTVLEEECSKMFEYVVPVNFNSPVQTVIAGTEKGIEEAMQKLKEKGAKKVVKLNVSAGFHSKLMQPAADMFIKAIRDVKFNRPDCRFFSNVSGEELTSFDNMPELLAKHIISPVKFTHELQAIWEKGYDTFIECGPNKVLTGLVKKTLPDAKAINIENLETLEQALA